MPLEIIREDITRVKVDCILNPTDNIYSGSGGTDRRVHEAAGIELDNLCSVLSPLKTGEVVLTPAFDMTNCKHIIHTVGPIFNEGSDADVRNCYVNALNKAKEVQARSIAMPLVSTGTFKYPKKDVLRIATNVISDFLYENEMDVYLLVYDKEAFDISKKLYRDVKDYLSMYGLTLGEEVFNSCSISREHFLRSIEPEECAADTFDTCSIDFPYLDDYIEDESFNECLRRFIREKNLLEKDVYKRANLTKQAFNGIYNEKNTPKKGNVLALAIGLGLNIDEAEEFIEKAGYSFGYTKQDYVIRYFIEHEYYDIFEINCFLLDNDLPFIGSKYE
ncbi:MAG: macro domain-containing protein [Erysipelotrichaceae bacterium]|nr:macro domain-containing protein [Erysipelotrichaceae bacterium]